jgi:hypothetical protein
VSRGGDEWEGQDAEREERESQSSHGGPPKAG